MPTDGEKIDWYVRRVAALETLLANYRIGKTTLSEKLHHELETTRLYVGSKGEWLGASTANEDRHG